MQLIVLGVVLFLLIASSSGMDGNIYKPGKDLFFIGSFLAQYLFLIIYTTENMTVFDDTCQSPIQG